MTISSLKQKITDKLQYIVLIFIVLHPLLDVLSYFLSQRGSNAISTLLRFALLGGVAMLGFFLSEKKKIYLALYLVMGLFWLLHVLNCFRIGYQSFVEDTSNYLRIISLPIYALSLITIFEKGHDIRKAVWTGFAINFGLIIIFTALPWLLGTPIYTYDNLDVGLMGWFSVKNAQSAIIALLTPITIFFAYKTKRYLAYVLVLLLTFGMLFMTGTKLTFYSIFLLAGGLIFLFALNLKKKSVIYIFPLLMIIAATVLFRSYSPMAVRNSMDNYSQGNYSALVSGSTKSSADETSIYISSLTESQLIERERKKLFGVYTDRAVYGTVFSDINDRFGVYNVMESFENTQNTSILSDTRERKTYYAKMIWAESDLLTKMFGFEYSNMQHGDTNYDLENDFPAVFFFCGYFGFALYMLIFVYFVFIVLRCLFRDITHFLTIEMGVVGMSFVLALGAAQISGNVLRRPNVTSYFAVFAAYLFYLTVTKLPPQVKYSLPWKRKKSKKS